MNTIQRIIGEFAQGKLTYSDFYPSLLMLITGFVYIWITLSKSKERKFDTVVAIIAIPITIVLFHFLFGELPITIALSNLLFAGLPIYHYAIIGIVSANVGIVLGIILHFFHRKLLKIRHANNQMKETRRPDQNFTEKPLLVKKLIAWLSELRESYSPGEEWLQKFSQIFALSIIVFSSTTIITFVVK